MKAFGLVAEDEAFSQASTCLNLRVYESIDELSALREAWDQLLTEYPYATTFSTWEWLSSWWGCFGKGRQLLVLALFDSGSLVGLAPLSIYREHVGRFSLRVLRLMGDGSGDSDNLDLPVKPGSEQAFAEAILRYLRQEWQRWDVCLLNTLQLNSLVADCLKEFLKSSSWTLFEYSSESSAVALPESWDAYTQMLSSEDRKNLARYTRRLRARYSTQIYRCLSLDQLPVCMDALMRLHQQRWRSKGTPGTFSSPERRDFYDRLSRRLLSRGWLELWVLELDGEIAAVQFAFRYGQRVFQLQEGYDHKRSSDRPGFVLRAAALQQLIQEKVRTYDFLGGADPYKSRWGACSGHYINVHFARPRSYGSALLWVSDGAAKCKRSLRRTLPDPAWRILHLLNLVIQGKLTRANRSGITHI